MCAGMSPTMNLRSMLSNFLRPSSSVHPPTLHTREKRKRLCSHTLTMFSFISSIFALSLNSSRRLSYSRIRLPTRLMSCIGTIILHSLVITRRQGGTSQSKSATTWSRSSALEVSPSGSVVIQLTMVGRHPRSEGCTYTMPQRDTVAGEATARSATSKIMFISPLIATISPLLRQSFLLSSSTVFMFSIQMASTGPSKTTHFRMSLVSRAMLRNSTASTPSVHSLETGSSCPYSCPMVTDLGLRVTILVFFSSLSPFSLSSSSAPLSTRIAEVFMPKESPTTMRPCRTMIIS
mmetsp:Transcript_66610/g.210908  ORF Transcript_66610/g.210908 Transcript_66610/m.210908 type:complete len:292 (+) Transcript_66610:2718-3593(+)